MIKWTILWLWYDRYESYVRRFIFYQIVKTKCNTNLIFRSNLLHWKSECVPSDKPINKQQNCVYDVTHITHFARVHCLNKTKSQPFKVFVPQRYSSFMFWIHLSKYYCVFYVMKSNMGTFWCFIQYLTWIYLTRYNCHHDQRCKIDSDQRCKIENETYGKRRS